LLCSGNRFDFQPSSSSKKGKCEEEKKVEERKMKRKNNLSPWILFFQQPLESKRKEAAVAPASHKQGAQGARPNETTRPKGVGVSGP
jgi:hypothetical protein